MSKRKSRWDGKSVAFVTVAMSGGWVNDSTLESRLRANSQTINSDESLKRR